MTLASLEAFACRRSTILGLATMAATIAAVVGHQISLATAVPALVFGLVAILVPERTDVQLQAQTVAADAVQVVQQRGMGPSTLQLGSDLVSLAGSLHPSTPVVPVVTAAAPAAAAAGSAGGPAAT